MNKSAPNTINDWTITYSEYVDTLHVFDKSINKKSNKELQKIKAGHVVYIFDKNTHSPLMLEVDNATHNFGDVDKMDKKLIIQKVKELVNNYGSTE